MVWDSFSPGHWPGPEEYNYSHFLLLPYFIYQSCSTSSLTLNSSRFFVIVWVELLFLVATRGCLWAWQRSISANFNNKQLQQLMTIVTAVYLEVIIYKCSRINQKTQVNVPSFFWLWYERLLWIEFQTFSSIMGYREISWGQELRDPYPFPGSTTDGWLCSYMFLDFNFFFLFKGIFFFYLKIFFFLF